MLDNITEQNQLFIKFLRPVAIILVFMSLQRGLYEVVAGLNAKEPLPLGQHIEIYLIGLRFDLLVWSFAFLPLFLFLLTKFQFKLKNQMSQIYLSVVWVGFSLINLLNLPYFALNQKHLNWPEWSFLNAVEIFTEWLSGPQPFLKILVVVFIILSCTLGIVEIRQGFSNSNKSILPKSLNRKKILLQFMASLLVIAFCARGKIGVHHLRREDSQITDFAEWNELALNAQWSFNKDDR